MVRAGVANGRHSAVISCVPTHETPTQPLGVGLASLPFHEPNIVPGRTDSRGTHVGGRRVLSPGMARRRSELPGGHRRRLCGRAPRPGWGSHRGRRGTELLREPPTAGQSVRRRVGGRQRWRQRPGSRSLLPRRRVTLRTPTTRAVACLPARPAVTPRSANTLVGRWRHAAPDGRARRLRFARRPGDRGEPRSEDAAEGVVEHDLLRGDRGRHRGSSRPLHTP